MNDKFLIAEKTPKVVVQLADRWATAVEV